MLLEKFSTTKEKVAINENGYNVMLNGEPYKKVIEEYDIEGRSVCTTEIDLTPHKSASGREFYDITRYRRFYDDSDNISTLREDCVGDIDGRIYDIINSIITSIGKDMIRVSGNSGLGYVSMEDNIDEGVDEVTGLKYTTSKRVNEIPYDRKWGTALRSVQTSGTVTSDIAKLDIGNFGWEYILSSSVSLDFKTRGYGEYNPLTDESHMNSVTYRNNVTNTDERVTHLDNEDLKLARETYVRVYPWNKDDVKLYTSNNIVDLYKIDDIIRVEELVRAVYIGGDGTGINLIPELINPNGLLKQAVKAGYDGYLSNTLDAELMIYAAPIVAIEAFYTITPYSLLPICPAINITFYNEDASKELRSISIHRSDDDYSEIRVIDKDNSDDNKEVYNSYLYKKEI